MLVRNVVRTVVVVVDEELMVPVAYAKNVRIRWCDGKLVSLSDSLVMYSSIRAHIRDPSGIESVAEEMLPLKIPYGEILCFLLDLFIRHSVSVMEIFVFFAWNFFRDFFQNAAFFLKFCEVEKSHGRRCRAVQQRREIVKRSRNFKRSQCVAFS